MDDLRVTDALTIPAAELSVRTSRSGGPGGQHVNKTETRVEIRWSVSTSETLSDEQRDRLEQELASRLTRSGELIVVAADHRSQARNLESARDRLAETVASALQEPTPRVATRPSRAAVRRRLTRKKRTGQKKRDRTFRGDDE